jgi:hypothetical protein
MSLTETVKLVRFCTNHPEDVEEFYCSKGAFEEKIACARQKDCNQTIEPAGVFLRHVGCEAENLLWDKEEVEKVKAVEHWEINMLQAITESTNGTSREMWFPLMLLRATGEKRRGKRCGVLVELIGQRSVGKTVLAMQAMDNQGYVPSDGAGDRHVEVQDYIYSRPSKGAAENPLLDTLYLRTLMSKNKSAIFLPRGTLSTMGDLKVVFLMPAQQIPEEVKTSEKKSLWDSVSDFVEQVKDEAVSLPQNMFKPQGGLSSAFWHTVAFYDTAGEASERNDPLLDKIERAVDKVAILIDAKEIFYSTSSDESSIGVAVQRIKKLKNLASLQISIVVTKLDIVWDRMDKGEAERVQHIAEDLNRDPQDTTEAHALLIQWLSKNKNDNNRELLNYLKTIKHVFFVWTQSLPVPKALVQKKGPQPFSYGLARFICWCLGIRWAEINIK